MYFYFDGELVLCDGQTAVVDCGGVGYELSVSTRTASLISGTEHVRLFAHQSVKEDSITLFGFADLEEKELFLLLTGVTGVGPKAAIAILSEFEPADLAAAVMAGDYRRITKANGVGQKLAQRICLELKDKLGDLGVHPSATAVAQATAGQAVNDDACQALVALGYSRSAAEKALEKCTADNVQDLIRQALRIING